MDITLPKKRDSAKWSTNLQSKKTLFEAIQNNKASPFSFKEYCEYSVLWLEAGDQYFLQKKALVERLTSQQINYKAFNRSETGDELKKEQDQGKKIMKVLTYAWNNIISLIKGKKENDNSNNLGIYTDDNINLHFARLEEMLKELKGKRYRCSVFIKENAYTREIAEKEMNEEIVFIKLLQNILRTQTNKIIQARKGENNPISPAIEQVRPPTEESEEEVIEEKLEDVGKIISGVNDYFQRKMTTLLIGDTSKDPIDRQQQNRRFNSAVIRYHLQVSQRR